MFRFLGTLLASAVFLAMAAIAAAADYPLYAGQTHLVGNVEVITDAQGDLEVTYRLTEPGWLITETHLHVGDELTDFPQKNGNPIPGRFRYSMVHNPGVTVFTYAQIDVGDLVSPLMIAAHAKIARYDTMTVFSDEGGSVMVTAGVPANFTYPIPAVRTYVHPSWNPSLRLNGNPFAFQQGQWIWESYYVIHPENDLVLTFEQTFSVPGVPVGGAKLHIAADNYYRANLNGAAVGERWTGPHGNWNLVGEYDLPVVAGPNTLVVDGWNLGFPGGPTGNPGGVIYEADIDFYTGEQASAWGGEEAFPGKNWATYFTYEP